MNFSGTPHSLTTLIARLRSQRCTLLCHAGGERYWLCFHDKFPLCCRTEQARSLVPGRAFFFFGTNWKKKLEHVLWSFKIRVSEKHCWRTPEMSSGNSTYLLVSLKQPSPSHSETWQARQWAGKGWQISVKGPKGYERAARVKIWVLWKTQGAHPSAVG